MAAVTRAAGGLVPGAAAAVVGMQWLRGDCEKVRITCSAWAVDHAANTKRLVDVDLLLPRVTDVPHPANEAVSAELLPLALALVAAAQAQSHSANIQTLANAYEPLRAAVCKQQNVRLHSVLFDLRTLLHTKQMTLGSHEVLFLAGVPSCLLKYQEEIQHLVLNCSHFALLHEDLCNFSHLEALLLNGNDSCVIPAYTPVQIARLHEQDFNGSLLKSCHRRAATQVRAFLYASERERVAVCVCVCAFLPLVFCGYACAYDRVCIFFVWCTLLRIVSFTH